MGEGDTCKYKGHESVLVMRELWTGQKGVER